MVRAELFLWSFSEETGMSDNLPTKRNLLASAFSSCEMGSVSCDTDKDMCEHWTHCWRWLESRTAMPRKMESKHARKLAHKLFFVFGKQYLCCMRNNFAYITLFVGVSLLFHCWHASFTRNMGVLSSSAHWDGSKEYPHTYVMKWGGYFLTLFLQFKTFSFTCSVILHQVLSHTFVSSQRG